MELKDFARILLKSGETKTVNFTIDKTKLMFWDINMQYVLEPGEFDIMVGSSSVDVKTVTFSVE
jgi:beta-glucosidase